MLQVLIIGTYPAVAPSGSAQPGSQEMQRTQARGQKGFGDFGPPRGDPSPAWRAHWIGGNRNRPRKMKGLGFHGTERCSWTYSLLSIPGSGLCPLFLALSHLLDSQHFEFCPLFQTLPFATCSFPYSGS